MDSKFDIVRSTAEWETWRRVRRRSEVKQDGLRGRGRGKRSG